PTFSDVIMFTCLPILYIFICFFFFQAEDGIRDRNVTGVQTCALPILELANFFQKIRETGELPRSSAPSPNDFYEAYKQVDPNNRSEERRVGKECRYRW